MEQQVETKKRMSSTPGLVLGIIAIVFGALSFIPFVGALTVWIAIILAVIGIILAVLSRGTAAIVVNVVAIVLCIGAYVYQMQVAKKTGYALNEYGKDLVEQMEKAAADAEAAGIEVEVKEAE
ncbi:MAG: hypothetical protein WC966_05540 [Bradymonadales bacterium]